MSRVKHCDSNGKVYVANVINTQMFLIACKGIIKDPTKFFYLSCYDNGCNKVISMQYHDISGTKSLKIPKW